MRTQGHLLKRRQRGAGWQVGRNDGTMTTTGYWFDLKQRCIRKYAKYKNNYDKRMTLNIKTDPGFQNDGRYRPASHPSVEQTADTDQPVIHLLNRQQIQTIQSSIC